MLRARVALLLLCLLSAPVHAASPDDPAQARITALLLRIGGVGARHARFTEEKTLAAIDGKLISSGRLVFLPPDHLEQATLQPHPETVVADGDRLTIRTGDAAPEAIDLASQPEIRALVDTVRATLSGDARLLRFYYAISMTGSAQDWELVLHPVAPQIARVVREVRVTGRAADPLSIVTVADNGDTTRLLIEPDA